MTTGELLTRWTIRVALACYVLCCAVLLSARGRRDWRAAARLLWTWALAAYLAHVACAFEFYHHWSHAAAYRHTAERTAALLGIRWGGGLYVNYLLMLVWLADAVWWWLRPAGYLARPRAVPRAVHSFVAFMAFNATVVFGAGAIRWAGIAACLLMGIWWCRLSVTANRLNRESAGTGST